MEKEFNIIIAGVGGQGIITLTRLLAETAMHEEHQVRTSELHGLSQRGGSVMTHLRFGKQIFSPLIALKEADLIIALEIQEALNIADYASRKRKSLFLINDLYLTDNNNHQNLSTDQITQQLQQNSDKVILLPASQKTQQINPKPVLAGIFLLGYAARHNLIPLKLRSFQQITKRTIPQKYLKINQKVFQLAKNEM